MAKEFIAIPKMKLLKYISKTEGNNIKSEVHEYTMAFIYFLRSNCKEKKTSLHILKLLPRKSQMFL